MSAKQAINDKLQSNGGLQRASLVLAIIPIMNALVSLFLFIYYEIRTTGYTNKNTM